MVSDLDERKVIFRCSRQFFHQNQIKSCTNILYPDHDPTICKHNSSSDANANAKGRFFSSRSVTSSSWSWRFALRCVKYKDTKNGQVDKTVSASQKVPVIKLYTFFNQLFGLCRNGPSDFDFVLLEHVDLNEHCLQIACANSL